MLDIPDRIWYNVHVGKARGNPNPSRRVPFQHTSVERLQTTAGGIPTARHDPDSQCGKGNRGKGSETDGLTVRRV